jgi:hypothetical protein
MDRIRIRRDSGSPAGYEAGFEQGEMYYDLAGKKLYIFDGSSFIDIVSGDVATVPSSSLLDDLVEAWPMNELSGPRVGAHASISLTDNNTVGSTTGKLGNAASFVAANSEYLSIASAPSLEFGDTDFSIACWVKIDVTGTNIIAAKRSNTEFAWQLYQTVGGSNEIIFGINGTSFVSVANNPGERPSTGVWYYVVAWHDATANTVNIQVNNGTVYSQSTGTVVPNTTTAPLKIGSNGTYYSDIAVDQLILANRIWTADERSSLWNSGSGLVYPF